MRNNVYINKVLFLFSTRYIGIHIHKKKLTSCSVRNGVDSLDKVAVRSSHQLIELAHDCNIAKQCERVSVTRFSIPVWGQKPGPHINRQKGNREFFFYKMSYKTIVPEEVVDYPDMRRCVVVD